jgi:hypothetical protein
MVEILFKISALQVARNHIEFQVQKKRIEILYSTGKVLLI